MFTHQRIDGLFVWPLSSNPIRTTRLLLKVLLTSRISYQPITRCNIKCQIHQSIDKITSLLKILTSLSLSIVKSTTEWAPIDDLLEFTLNIFSKEKKVWFVPRLTYRSQLTFALSSSIKKQLHSRPGNGTDLSWERNSDDATRNVVLLFLIKPKYCI